MRLCSLEMGKHENKIKLPTIKFMKWNAMKNGEISSNQVMAWCFRWNRLLNGNDNEAKISLNQRALNSCEVSRCGENGKCVINSDVDGSGWSNAQPSANSSQNVYELLSISCFYFFCTFFSRLMIELKLIALFDRMLPYCIGNDENWIIRILCFVMFRFAGIYGPNIALFIVSNANKSVDHFSD